MISAWEAELCDLRDTMWRTRVDSGSHSCPTGLYPPHHGVVRRANEQCWPSVATLSDTGLTPRRTADKRSIGVQVYYPRHMLQEPDLLFGASCVFVSTSAGHHVRCRCLFVACELVCVCQVYCLLLNGRKESWLSLPPRDSHCLSTVLWSPLSVCVCVCVCAFLSSALFR